VSRAWIVGGALRDELLGRGVTDIDIAVEGDPEAAARELAAQMRGPVFRLSEAFGAWRVVDRRGGRIYDFAPLQGATIEDDLRKRDFTVNAMARELEAGAPPGGRPGATAGELVDPLGGRADLDSRTLRVIGPEAYESDPLRPLRLARFAAELGFAPDPETARLTEAAAARVPEASGERVFAELRRLVLAPGAVAGLALATMSVDVLASLVYDVAPRDVPSFLVATLVLFVVSMAACFVPARRAASVDPSIALRSE
jgi:tRNA nucleotidyltransferase/poly(A) polymerase